MSPVGVTRATTRAHAGEIASPDTCTLVAFTRLRRSMARRLIALLKLTFGGTMLYLCIVIGPRGVTWRVTCARVSASIFARVFVTILTGSSAAANRAASCQPSPRSNASRGCSSPCGVYQTSE